MRRSNLDDQSESSSEDELIQVAKDVHKMTEAEIRSILKSYDQDDGRDKSELDAKLAHFFSQQKTSK